MTYDPVKWLRDNANAPSKSHEPDSPESRGLRRKTIDALMEEAMSPRKNPLHPMFRDHNCAYCGSGERVCKQGNPFQCEFPHARND